MFYRKNVPLWERILRTAVSVGLIAAGNDGTGFIVLVDAKKKTRLGRVTSNMTEMQMTEAFRQALAKSSIPTVLTQ